MIDVHCLLTTPQDHALVGRCLESLEGEPITLFLMDGIKDHLGQGRVRAFKAGSNPYVGWVDPDDYILPKAYTKCTEYLLAHPEADGVYMWEQIEIDGKVVRDSTIAHHMTVVKREVVEQLYPKIEANPNNCEMYINALRTLHCIPEFGYRWCVRPDSYMHTPKTRR